MKKTNFKVAQIKYQKSKLRILEIAAKYDCTD